MTIVYPMTSHFLVVLEATKGAARAVILLVSGYFITKRPYHCLVMIVEKGRDATKIVVELRPRRELNSYELAMPGMPILPQIVGIYLNISVLKFRLCVKT